MKHRALIFSTVAVLASPLSIVTGYAANWTVYLAPEDRCAPAAAIAHMIPQVASPDTFAAYLRSQGIHVKLTVIKDNRHGVIAAEHLVFAMPTNTSLFESLNQVTDTDGNFRSIFYFSDRWRCLSEYSPGVDGATPEELAPR
jgi:hypothetical protein